MRIKHTQKIFWISEGLVLLAALLYCSWPLGFVLNPLASRTGLASELGAIGQPYNWVFIGGDVASGIVLVVAVVALYWLIRPRGWVRICMLALAVYGICGALDAALPLQCIPSTMNCGPMLQNGRLLLHGAVDLIGSTALIVTLFAAWRAIPLEHRQAQLWIRVIGVASVIFGIMSLVLWLLHGPGYWAQRYYITISCVWVASIPFMLRFKLGAPQLQSHNQAGAFANKLAAQPTSVVR